MPYLRCSNCGLLAHVIPADHIAVAHCPRCRTREKQVPLATLEDSLRFPLGSPEQEPKPSR
jgi:uncharacterized paraquat-inducible protein A